jgi:hypothetical protein
VRRHPALVPLSQDHHRALVEARAVISGAAGDGPKRLAAGARFTAFFTAHAVPHFRCEEEDLFPLVASPPGDDPPEALVRALLDHSRLHALAGAIRDAVQRGDVDGELLIATGGLFRDHVRLEERTLLPLIEERAGDAGLAAIALHAAGHGLRAEESVVAALERVDGRGVVWSASSADLNVNLVDWPAGEGVAAHVTPSGTSCSSLSPGRERRCWTGTAMP